MQSNQNINCDSITNTTHWIFTCGGSGKIEIPNTEYWIIEFDTHNFHRMKKTDKLKIKKFKKII